ncbi:MAG: hypothetical protein ACOC03_05165 [Desulfosalsimonas sp.]
MSANKNRSQVTNAFQSWIITFSVLFFSLSGVVLALVCIYALPDRTVRPFEGSLFFGAGSIVLIVLLFIRWKKDIAILPNNQIEVKENLSDKILKWVTSFFCFGFVLCGLAIALICIYALPDKTFQPQIGAIYFLGSAIVIASFVVVVWKNWISINKQTGNTGSN